MAVVLDTHTELNGVDLDGLLSSLQEQREDKIASHEEARRRDLEAFCAAAENVIATHVVRPGHESSDSCADSSTSPKPTSSTTQAASDKPSPKVSLEELMKQVALKRQRRTTTAAVPSPTKLAESQMAMSSMQRMVDNLEPVVVEETTSRTSIDENSAVRLVDDAEACFTVGDAEAALDKLDKSIAGLKTARALSLRAKVHFELHNYHEAEADLTSCLALTGMAGDCLALRGSIRIKLLDYEGACQDLEAALSIQQDDHIFSEYRRARRFLGRKPQPAPAMAREASGVSESTATSSHVDEFALERSFWQTVQGAH